jgi:ribosomal-protein-alanine N-acetyltransferase
MGLWPGEQRQVSDESGLSQSGLPIHVRWIVSGDLQAVCEIEATVFNHPWNSDKIVECLRHRHRIGLVAEKGGQVVGFIFYEMMTHFLDIPRLAVHPNYQRQGVGSELIKRLKNKLSPQGRFFITCTVPDTDKETHLFLQKMEFKATTVLSEHFTSPNEVRDGYLFVFELDLFQLPPRP